MTGGMVVAGEDPLHDSDSRIASWTTANAGEQLPGVLTPLTARMWDVGTEVAMRHAYRRIGALSSEELTVPSDVDMRVIGFFCGRIAANESVLGVLADRIPFTSGGAFTRDMYGDPTADAGTKSRWAVELVHSRQAANAAVRVERELQAACVGADRFWRETIQRPPASLDEARAILWGSQRWFEYVNRFHLLGTVLAQITFNVVSRFVGNEAVGGSDKSEDVGVAQLLWEVAHGSATRDAILERYGFHGPAVGELSNPSWRESPYLLDQLVGAYAEVTRDSAPMSASNAARTETLRLRRELLKSMSVAQRAIASAAIHLADRFLGMRSTGKSATLKCFDAARLSARVTGAELVRRKQLLDVDDVFLLTGSELILQALPGKEIIEFRRSRREEYFTVDLPVRWRGLPEPTKPAETASTGADIRGVGASPGLVRGTVRIVRNQGSDRFQPGCVLVCRSTDPSWVSLIALASGLIVDVGGPISHGAIVAREFGIPCVIGTGSALEVLNDGDVVEVDGNEGVVKLLDGPVTT